MICHKNKIIFIHIPKCAGSSVEHYFEVKPFDWKTPNYQNLTGWCPKRKIHMHHATANELLETELIDEDVWNEYYKFTIVRNPWSRAFSDYLWLNRFNYINSSFTDFINKKGKLSKILNDKSVKEYRGDHLYPQIDFLTINNEIVVDKILFFENIKSEFKQFINSQNLPTKSLPHSKKAKKMVSHYSHFYKDEEEELISNIYSKDIKMFDYFFDDRRDELSDFRKSHIHFIRNFK